MKAKIMYILFTIILCGVTFFLGTKWQKENITSNQTYKLTSDITVQVSPESIGKIPKGTTLYEFRSMGETTTYVVFVNLKNQSVLSFFEHKHANTVDPMDGYTE